MASALTLHKVAYRAGGVDILEDVSVSSEPGEAWAIIGANGAGKSTLLRVTAGLLAPSGGEVRLGDARVHKLARRELARARAFVSAQAASQHFDFGVLELVLMGEHASTARFSLPSQEQQARALAILEGLELGALAARAVTALSSGELQRVMLARALMTRAPLLLLDEPTANLDMRHQLMVLERVREHAHAGGMVWAAVHDLSLVEAYFDRVMILHKGSIRWAGRPRDVMREEHLSEVFGVSLRVIETSGRRLWYTS